jgi:hypothetical protein
MRHQKTPKYGHFETHPVHWDYVIAGRLSKGPLADEGAKGIASRGTT